MPAERGSYVDCTWEPSPGETKRQRRGGTYRAFVPAAIAGEEPALGSGTAARSEKAAQAVRELNADGGALVPLEGLGRLLLRSEALASSQIEGLSISNRKLAQAELEGQAGPYKAREILGAVHAMELAMEIGAAVDPPSVAAITRIHEALAVAPPLDRIGGQIREEASWIGGSSPLDAEFVGPPFQHVRPLLNDLCEFIDRDDIGAIPQAAIAHAQFELIHPFGDGNGRVGRCLIQVILRRRGLTPRYAPPISLVLGANKDAYIAGIHEFREGKLDAWVDYFSRAVERASLQAKSFSAAVVALQERWREMVQPARADSAVFPLIDVLPKLPIITAAVAEREIGRSRPVTIEALSRLAEIGALTRHRNQKRGDSWEAKELFGLLDEFEDAARLPAG
jgi:Fic family protein